jgi:chromosomal replication initiator protein
MNKLIEYLKTKYGITVTVEELLAQFKSDPIVVDPMKIITEVCYFYDVKYSDIREKRRFRDLVSPKHVAIYFLDKLTHLSNKEVMAYFGQQHTMVQHAKKAIKDRMDTEPDFRKEISLLNTHLRIKMAM